MFVLDVYLARSLEQIFNIIAAEHGRRVHVCGRKDVMRAVLSLQCWKGELIYSVRWSCVLSIIGWEQL